MERFIVIWFAVIWVLWKTPKTNIFKNREGQVDYLLEDIKIKSWKWLRSKVKGLSFLIN